MYLREYCTAQTVISSHNSAQKGALVSGTRLVNVTIMLSN